MDGGSFGPQHSGVRGGVVLHLDFQDNHPALLERKRLRAPN